MQYNSRLMTSLDKHLSTYTQMKMQKKNKKMNERRQEYDINVMAGPGRIECVKVEAPLRLLEKSAGCRMREEGKKEKKED